MSLTSHNVPPVSDADLVACRKLLSVGSRTFYAASLLLPKRVRDPATCLYAFCRVADDAVDLEHASEATLQALNQRLDRAYEGRPFETPVDRALSSTVLSFGIPRALLDALIEGFRWDAEGRTYETLSELHGYAARVAGTVGTMMAILMGRRKADDLARAADLGIAMQLTNIARDVGEDARAGRIYLPLSWLRSGGLSAESVLRDPKLTPTLANAIEALLQAADTLYRRADGGIANLPSDCRPGIRAARLLYADIGRTLSQRGLDSVTQRSVVSVPRKLALLTIALAPSLSPRTRSADAPIDAARFLVDAVERDPFIPPRETGPGLPAWWNLHARAVRLVELIDALERRDRLRAQEY